MQAKHRPPLRINSTLRTNPTGFLNQVTGKTFFWNNAGIRMPALSNLICLPLSPQSGSTSFVTALHFLFRWYLAIKLLAMTLGSSG